jgi:hypothetical protein
MEYYVKAHWEINTDAEDEKQPVRTERLEETLASTRAKVTVVPIECDLRADLPIPLKAEVLRNFDPHQEVVRLSSNGKHVDLIRGKDIGVSCNPKGDRVPVRTINVDFRDVDDDLTDRGIVWVFPGNPASMQLVIHGEAMEIPGKITEIIVAAEEAVRSKVLAHFT